jgi:UDP-2,4-diacetamido-2,4,6-trideoxy-beta-L-altropyranose hydrolase
MRVVIRADASRLTGTGHIMRCLTFANYLSDGGAQVDFVCRDLPGNLTDTIKTRGYSVQLLPAPNTEYTAGSNPDDYAAWLGVPAQQDADETIAALAHLDERIDWMIVDHYGLGIEWETQVGRHVGNMMVIDDLANRQHECNVLLDQNFYLDLKTRYDSLIPEACERLLGPGYAILRPEFFEAKQAATERTGAVRRVLVFYGGCDATGETIKTVRAIGDRTSTGIQIDVVAGAANERWEEIQGFCADRPEINLHARVDEMARMMSRADFAFGGGGTTTWERCFLGLPTATIEVADNQRVMLNDMATNGAIWHLGRHTDVTESMLAECLDRAVNRPGEVAALGRKTELIMAGKLNHERCPAAGILLGWTGNS